MRATETPAARSETPAILTSSFLLAKALYGGRDEALDVESLAGGFVE